MIAVVGSRKELQSAYIFQCLKELGERPCLLETADFPEKVAASLEPGRASYAEARLSSIRVAYLRSTFSSPEQLGQGIRKDMERNWYGTLMRLREKSNFLSSLLFWLRSKGVRLVNPLESQYTMFKPFQLERLKSAGIPLPRTLVTNDPGRVRAFARLCKRVIYKPVTGGAATRELLPSDLTSSRLELLKNAPVTFQELVPGFNVRVYVVGPRVVSSSIIHTEKLDFREGEGPVEPIRLPQEVRRLCLKAARACKLLFTGIDLKWDGKKRYTFLECNVSPMFCGYDRKAKAQVGPSLARYLISLSRG